MALVMNAIVGLMAAVCVAVLVWGGWLCIAKPKSGQDGQGKDG